VTPESRDRVTGVVVRVAGSRWYLPVESVVEVLRGRQVARLPGAPASVVGVVNHRGRVLTVADPVRALALPGEGVAARDLVVVEAGDRRFVVGVDAVIELLTEPRTGLARLDLEAVARALFGST
jgi:purine-binding chemotaxis protein CheW